MHRPVHRSLALFLGHLGHGEGEQVGDGGADPEAGVLGLQLGDAGVDGGGVVEDVLLVWQPGLHLCNQGQEFRPVSAVGWGRLLKTAPGRTAASIRIVLLGLASGPAPGTHYNIGLLLLWRYFGVFLGRIYIIKLVGN